MKRFRTAKEMTDYVVRSRESGKTVGFVPTMGALHEGHYSLVRRSQEGEDLTVCSIFVNPTQFNESSDLEAYPRMEEADCISLEKIGCDAVFLPTVNEIYPPGDGMDVALDLGHLDTVLEGAFRPGHFEGVVQVVKRLLDIIPCDGLYMGQKDWQQTAVIAYMLRHYNLDVRLVRCPTLRDPDGLAMSSRNERLTPLFRYKAPLIYRVLEQAKEWVGHRNPQEISRLAMEFLQGGGLRPEYFEIVDPDTLLPVKSWVNQGAAIACTAAWAGEVRLIDNLMLMESSGSV